MHHGGSVSDCREDLYGGKVSEFLLDLDKLSHFEITRYIADVGFNEIRFFCVLDPCRKVYVIIINDIDLLEFCKGFKDGDILDIYVEHVDKIENVCGNNRKENIFLDDNGGLQGANWEIDGGL